ncbi:hypothetical protein [Pseudomonas sp. BMS12]|uniref:hypothetical protein n=1 Tax=Pseudomonas sp. BMS12 TaxID=1796033 RepID=UPI00083A5AED|nr:hypothetical protein [Pseudomonas sp. BMS12]
MDRAAPAPRSKLKIALSLLALLAAATIAYGQWQALPQYAQLFAAFGAEVPWPSALLVEHPQGVWIYLRCALAHNFVWFCTWLISRERWASAGLGLATACTWLSLALILIALYLPMFTIAV